MTILLARIVPRDQLVVIHAPLSEVEWPGTIEHIQNTIPCRRSADIRARGVRQDACSTSVEERGKCFPEL